ncbi:unnamed protein product [Pleuronectes platessa]|uniref:Uncharacterized protein n=1 Tax=Pleuronectes platessa TaxID=8262 RepID=A0A9N7W515_PLEPL|nr:unnamed protein product [Pleuronectes platessa]
MNPHGVLHRHAHLGAYNAGLHDLLVPPGQVDDPQRIDHVVIWDNVSFQVREWFQDHPQAMEEACGDIILLKVRHGGPCDRKTPALSSLTLLL